MTKTNMARVVLGGILAGLILNILGFLVDGILLAPQWNAGMSALGRSGEITMNQIVGFNILGFCYGIAVVWLYAAIRPRYGAGPKTAVTAGLALWVGGVLLPNVGFMSVNGRADDPPTDCPAIPLVAMVAALPACARAAPLSAPGRSGRWDSR